MAALRDIARDFAAEIRDGIGWTIVYRTGRSWNALTFWSDIWNGEWETDDLNDAIGILKADPDAVIVNGYGNVLSISRSGNELHPTQKPVELLEKLVDNTDFATGVYDPFGGSGTTLAACEAYGQPSYIMELTPAFTDVIVKRYIRITGKTTVRCVRQGRELPREEIAAIFEPDEEGGEQE